MKKNKLIITLKKLKKKFTKKRTDLFIILILN